MKLLGLTGQKIVTKYYANVSEILYSQVFSNSPPFLNQQTYKWELCNKQDLAENKGGTDMYSFPTLENNFKCRLCYFS